ncbi:chromate efflux transporter [Roseomonas haemaphysalidis]|uniref:Chromate efflux transporter n=1 Tax=Roseomonas haemaphysalidis TaxID=2768162 RepID=A0ABS3KQ72_9PROT|nr:chromate efflux transporter [Roseomonas haemaphysalidis]MBO1079172.1 chromate efflux transporter [Roseomonas haemaphysalidis]
MTDTPPPTLPTLAQATRVWARIGLLSFGGPAGQIALMHRELVEQRRWIGERRFLQALNFCALLPGPEAQQLATYLGWLMHGPRGGLVAGLLFILPGAAVMLALSVLFATLGTLPAVAALFAGLKCAVLVMVLQALVRLAGRALHGPLAWCLAGAAFAALFLLALPFPLVVAVAALAGLLAPAGLNRSAATADDGPPELIDAVLAAEPARAARLAAGARRAGLLALLLWLLPVALLLAAGPAAFADIAVFFSKMAVVTVGGAYAVLAYVAQDAVRLHGWLTAQEMLAGLGLAESTPGPLILVLQFVGFLAGARAAAGPGGVAGGMLGSLLVLWVTFAPCFAFVFLGAPWIERLQNSARLSGALAGVTAAVVGVIANLALWFGLRVLFRAVRPAGIGPLSLELPVWSSLDGPAVLLVGLAAACLFGLRLGVVACLLVAALAGLALAWAGLPV